MNMTPEAKMIQFVKTCDDPKRLRTIAENADRNVAGDLARAARLRLYSVLPSEDLELWGMRSGNQSMP